MAYTHIPPQISRNAMAHERQDEFRRAYFILYIKGELAIFEEIESSIENTETNEFESSLLKERLLPSLYRKGVEELMDDPGLEIVAHTWWAENFIDTLPPLQDSGSLVIEIARLTADDSETDFAKTANEVQEWFVNEIQTRLPEHIDIQVSSTIAGVS